MCLPWNERREIGNATLAKLLKRSVRKCSDGTDLADRKQTRCRGRGHSRTCSGQALTDLGDWAGMKRTIYAIICVALIAAGAALLFSMSLDRPDEPFTSSKLQDG